MKKFSHLLCGWLVVFGAAHHARAADFRIASATADPGAAVSLAVTVSGFAGVTSAQFTIEWNPAVLQSSAPSDFGLAGMAAGSFGTAIPGKLTFSWDAPDAAGKTVADGTRIFSLNFTAIGANGTSSSVALADAPTVREVTIDFAATEFVSRNGSVTVGAAPPEKKTPTIVWANPGAIVYGMALGAGQLNAAAQDPDTQAAVPGTFVYTPASGAVLNAGTGQSLRVRFTPTATAIYNNSAQAATIEVRPAPLTITAENKTKAALAPVPPLTAVFAGFVNNDTPASLDTPLLLATTATDASLAGVFPITPSGASDANYRINFVNGALTVLPRGANDFNGDGFPNLAFEDARGFLAAWSMNGFKLASASLFEPNNVGDPSWRLFGAGDFNSDSFTDLAFQNPDGAVALWLMQGLNFGSSVLLPDPGAGRRAVTVADFNGDQKSDLLFQGTDGTLIVFYLNGVAISGASFLNPTAPDSPSWRVAGSGWFNEDSHVDLVFQHEDGSLAVWLMDGINILEGLLLNPPHPGDGLWRAVAVLDLNQDGKSDLVFQHLLDGILAAWFMDGTELSVGEPLVPNFPGGTWKVLAP